MPGAVKSPSSKKSLSPVGSDAELPTSLANTRTTRTEEARGAGATETEAAGRRARQYTRDDGDFTSIADSPGGEAAAWGALGKQEAARGNLDEESSDDEVQQEEAVRGSQAETSIGPEIHSVDAQALLALPTPPRCKVQLSFGESRLNGLLQHRLFGASHPLSDAAAAKVAASKASGRGVLKHLAPDDSSNMTFQPQVLEKSRNLASARNAAWVYADEEEPDKLIPFSTSERLYADLPADDQRKAARKLLRQAEIDKDNTFAPVISKQSKALVAAKETQDGKGWWDVLSKPKTEKEKVQDKGPEKKSPEQKRVENWNKMHKKVPFTYKPGQDVEPYECTFQPQISPKAQKYVKSAKSARGSSPRKKMVASYTSYAEDSSLMHTTFESHEFHPAFDLIANFYKRNPLMGKQTQPLAKAYQQPHLSGLRPYSRSHNGISANMQLHGDPVFEDLHDMLHSMKL